MSNFAFISRLCLLKCIEGHKKDKKCSNLALADNSDKSAVWGTRAFKQKGGTISRRIVPTWYLYALMNKLAIRLWMDGLNLNVIVMFLPI